MHRVPVKPKPYDAYCQFMERAAIEEVRELVDGLRGARVVHVNATPDGGGVAEILRSLVPLQRDLGLNADWFVLTPPPQFFDVTKLLHNLLQGEDGEISSGQLDLYWQVSTGIHESMKRLHADMWIIHDPQPAAAGAWLDGGALKIWRSHIDTSRPNRAALSLIGPLVSRYDALVYSHASYRLPRVHVANEFVIPPAIDPLCVKNRLINHRTARRRISALGMDPRRPLVSQVARFDKWKDPIGVIEAYRLARQEVSGLQLALLGVMTAQDDPEALEMYLEVEAAAGNDPDIHVFAKPASIHTRDIAAVQAASDVVIQKSLREGFGLSVTEAMWQGKPVVAGDTPGLRLQVTDGENGFLVRDVAHCAQRIVDLLRDGPLAQQLGEKAQQHVREHYLLPRLLLDELRTYHAVLAKDEGRVATAAG